MQWACSLQGYCRPARIFWLLGANLVTDRQNLGGGITRYRGHAWVPALAAVLAVAGACPAAAQNSGSVSHPVVQALPNPSILDLETALQRLAANPRDITALIAAGSASLEVEDMDAAIGFFSRAGELSPTDPRPKAGLGAALVRSENPYDALLMFEEAERYGASSALLAGDRGLAWDLVGNNSQAQIFYRQALASGPNSEVTRRLALSLAMSGEAREAQKVLQPLLDSGDPAARRTQAFVLGISGDSKEAAEVAQKAMPRALADRISPYLRYMPRLTPAQQAAAANFGHFPTTAEIGKDDPRVAKYNKDSPAPRVARGADTNLVPAGEPLGGTSTSTKKLSRREQREAEKSKAQEVRAQQAAAELAAKKQAELAQAEATRKARTAAAAQAAAVPRPSVTAAAPVPAPSMPAWAVASPPAEQPESALASVRASQEVPGPSVSLAPPTPTAQPSPGFILSAQTRQSEPGSSQIASFDPSASGAGPKTPAGGGELPPVTRQPEPLPGTLPAASPAPAPAAVPVPAQAAAAPAPSLAASVPAPAAGPAYTPATAAAPQAPLSVADAFADFSLKPSGPAVAAGAVDITKIKPRREEPPKPKAEPAPPPKPVIPSRAWVQVATGRDTAALAFDWRRITRGDPELFKGRKAYVASWGQTNRMVTGPFDSAKAAQDFVTALKAAGVDSFTFTSAEGEAVEPLGRDK